MPPENLRFRLKVYLIIFSAVMLLGTVGFMAVEQKSFADAVYFTIVTIATVGYGDISPITPLGKALTVLLIVTGVGTFVGVVANATDIFLDRREKEGRTKKLNMVIGLFFSEYGIELLRTFSQADPGKDLLGETLVVGDDWTGSDFLAVKEKVRRHRFQVQIGDVDLERLREGLKGQGSVLIRLLESPYLLEHEDFTDLLIAVVHLKEELLHRQTFDGLPDTDLQHLTGDITRVYTLLVVQWLGYMEHLKAHYPFLFSLALRTNPFDRKASPIVG